MALQTTLAECRWPSRRCTTAVGCTKGLAPSWAWMVVAAWVWTGAKRLHVSPCPSLLLVPSQVLRGSGGGTCLKSPLAAVRALLPAKPVANAVTDSGRKGQNCTLWRRWQRTGEQEKAEQESSWMPFYFTFSNGRCLFCAPSCNIRGAAEVLKGKREA